MSEPKHLLPLKSGFGLSHNRFLSLVPWPHVLLQALQEDHEPHIPFTTKGKIKGRKEKKWVFLPFLPEINFGCKVIKESLGFNTRFHAVNSSFQVLKFGFLVSGIWVLDYNFNGFLDSLGWALNSKPYDSVFQEKTFTGFWNLDSFAWNDIQRLFKRLEIKRKF